MPKRQTSFNPEWTKEHVFISKSSQDSFHGFWTLCHCDVDISSQGETAMERHAGTEKHKSNRGAADISSLQKIFREGTSPLDYKISAAELCKVYPGAALVNWRPWAKNSLYF